VMTSPFFSYRLPFSKVAVGIIILSLVRDPASGMIQAPEEVRDYSGRG
jgi:hypothetical protein